MTSPMVSALTHSSSISPSHNFDSSAHPPLLPSSTQPSGKNYRLSDIVVIALLFLAINGLTRIALAIAFSTDLPFSSSVVVPFLLGTLNDVVTLLFVLILPATAILLPTESFMRSRSGQVYRLSILFVFSWITFFTAFGEFFFWDEFHSRFNFIAVDYLIYTTEVINNIIESYPLFPMLLAITLLAGGITFLRWGKSKTLHQRLSTTTTLHAPQEYRRIPRFILLLTLYAIVLGTHALYSPITHTNNRYWSEYSKNGLYELFSAYLNNQLNYRDFYTTLDSATATRILTEPQQFNGNNKPSNQPSDTKPRIASGLLPLDPALQTPIPSPLPITPNVILVVMESMGSKWLTDENTPNLYAMANEGVSFTQMMSTGTRTVRGLEAIMLSIPPTPGNSIVRRRENTDLYTLGSVFTQRGYDCKFIYGGIGFFDNMNAFFAGNHYTVIDKLGFHEQSKSFANAWGQCDEDLYTQSLLEADSSYAQNKPFHHILLTTSNHRPFTYPKDKINTISGTSRTGAVQYADYAIGEFISQAQTKPWFDNTVFIFIGDHPSSIAGKTELPPDAYGIVCLLYGPHFFHQETVTTLCSQIDIGPTLLASLGWNDPTPFFGTNARTLPKEDGRAWISTYQLLGYRDNEHLVILTPNGRHEVQQIAPLFSRAGDTTAQEKVALADNNQEALVNTTVASYQCAYDFYINGLLKEKNLKRNALFQSHFSQLYGNKSKTAKVPLPHPFQTRKVTKRNEKAPITPFFSFLLAASQKSSGE